MNSSDLKIFESIKKKAKNDEMIWDEAQKSEAITLTPEAEERIMERMFFIYHIELYQKQIKEYKNILNEIRNHSTYSWGNDREFINKKIDELVKKDML